MADEVKNLKFARGQIKGSITRARKYLDGLKTMDKHEIKNRREAAIGKLQEFSEIQDQIEALEPSDENEAESESFEQSYFSVIADFDRLLVDQDPPPSDPSMHVNNSYGVNNSIRLPRIDLPQFSGEYEGWYPFYDTFNSLIHANNAVTSIQKFQYLKSSLKGDAAKVIQSLEISESNYNNAWAILKQRYDNKRLIVHTHLKAITDMPSMAKENSVGLRQLLDNILKHVRSLEALGRPVDKWDDWLVHTVTGKLDPITCKEWEGKLAHSELPSFTQLTEFLTLRCQVLEALSQNIANPNRHSQRQSTSSHVATKTFMCQICKGAHYIHQCEKFSAMPIPQRIKEARRVKLCLNCLRSTTHDAKTCNSGTCRECHKKHNTLLHLLVEPVVAQTTAVASLASIPATCEDNITIANVARDAQFYVSHQIHLLTAIVEVYDSQGRAHVARVMLDPASQSCFITKALMKNLDLKPRRRDTPIVGIGQATAFARQSVTLKFKSRINEFNRTVECVVLENITQDVPLITIPENSYQIPGNITLADPNYYRSSRIDVLLGVEVFLDILCVGQIKANTSHPSLQKTQLGWVMAGSIANGAARSQSVSCHIAIQDLNATLLRFWEIERCENNSTLTSEEAECETLFKTTYRRDAEGRFVVKLPCISDKITQLGDNREVAVKRFYNLEKSLNKQSTLKQEYAHFIREYIALKHMRLISDADVKACARAFYMPHHAVIKESSLTTRLRVVFDASCKSATGIALNDALKVGPTVQQDLVSILARFRTFKYTISGDIEKMYRQILIDESQTSLQRIVWRDDISETVKTYELLTVTYGTAPASFLATRCLQEIARLEGDSYPIGAAIVERDFYVDDLLTGANTLAEALVIRDQVIAILSKAKFVLRKWASNSPQLLEGVSCPRPSTAVLDLNKMDNIKTLGIQWNTCNDVLQYSITPVSSNRVTKRSILSSVARVFDPLGLIGPVIVLAKITIQRLWQLRLDWDESVPIELHTKWLVFETQLTELNKLQIERQVISSDPKCINLHGFSDASEEAYGACIYVVSDEGGDQKQARLLCAKSRVAPLKNASLPRLELCGALLLAKLIAKLVPMLNTSFANIYCWTDSSIVLAWIKSPSRNWNTFVANRIGEIQELLPTAQWGHVPTKQNPADIISRGAMPSEILHLSLWWKGPTEFFNRTECGGDQMRPMSQHELPERRAKTVCSTTLVNVPIAPFNEQIFDRYSSYVRLTRVVAYCFRFCYNASRRANNRRFDSLASDELMRAKRCLLKMCQADAFHSVIRTLSKRDGQLKSPLLQLNPFLDEQGILRVGGRLQHSKLPYRAKHPMLLPKSHPLTTLLIEFEHRRNFHAGCQATLSALRSEYWPLSARNTVRKVLRKCVACFKVAPNSSPYLMGDLPLPRVTPSRPFASTGIDYCGPFCVKEGKRRNAKTSKAYIAVFVCMSTKAVHLELISDMTTESFLGGLKRFMSRRGKPSHIHSDNGSNFVGANRELRALTASVFCSDGQAKINEYLNFEGITWHFIPPAAPHFGGLWEAAVKSAKLHIKRVAGNASLRFEEFYTLLVQIEAVLNARPLTPLSSDPSDLSPLTPSHFLIGDSMLTVIEPDLTDTPINRLSRWQHLEQLKQHFWRRWSKEYLHHLNQRNKWTSRSKRPLVPGDMVIVREDNLPPLQWLLGRVRTTSPGADGEVRAATVKTAKGIFSRPVSKLCLLPMEQ